MPGYEELKSELEVIAKTVEKFPEAVKPRVFELWCKPSWGKALRRLPSLRRLIPPLRPPAATDTRVALQTNAKSQVRKPLAASTPTSLRPSRRRLPVESTRARKATKLIGS